MREKTNKKITINSRQTKRVGSSLAKEILKFKNHKGAVVLALKGELGAGKTTFLQGFAKGLGVKEKVLSPTFIIIKKFKLKKANFKHFFHIDCYRIEKPEELLEIGFKEIIANPKHIVSVEWADKIKNVLAKQPNNVIWLNFKIIGKNKREIKRI